jgi:hypothetical protein
MATVPLYLLMLIVVLNWPVAIKAVTFQWTDQFAFHLLPAPRGSSRYLVSYLVFMAVLCVFPYLEENIRCIRYAKLARQSA